MQDGIQATRAPAAGGYRPRQESAGSGLRVNALHLPSGVTVCDLVGKGAIGQLLPAPASIGLDAVFLAILLALVLPEQRKNRKRSPG